MSQSPIFLKTSLSLSLGKTALEAAAQFAPIPALGPAAGLLCSIIQLCENVAQNRNAACQLRDRCHSLGLVLYEKCTTNENIAGAIQAATACFAYIQAKMAVWAAQSRVQAFLQQTEVKKSIEECHAKLTDCLHSFQLLSHIEIHEWQAQFAINAQKDHQELMQSLAGGIENLQDGLQVRTYFILHAPTAANSQQAQTTDIKRLMAMIQQLLGGTVQAGDHLHSGLASNLYSLQMQSRELLPDSNLRSGEVLRLNEIPIRANSTMYIYAGLYLHREKVDIKMIPVVKANEDSLRVSSYSRLRTRCLAVLTAVLQRFNRECKIWKELWKIDHGKHIVPFYGFCQEGTPFPYMVSPSQPNGTALDFVEKYDTRIDHLELIRGVALGVQVLHGMGIVHGDIKASNIAIDGLGNPLIANFGLSRIVEDIGMDTQSHGVSDSYRWFAPELCTGDGSRSFSSDVYAYGMTVLELLTHQHPYSNIKHTTMAVLKSAAGEKPERPTAPPRVLERGLDDAVWALLGRCWALEPAQRPNIQAVLETFPQ
ncbi:kinase-like domain-containing protein [Mycena pura]|uniref:Kinase-like domain-containing protein n=1 Tax=Mycena pura TaxID=153505 RepID=A0AAD6YNX0_9AGAR|nr:kinase-like domain-containing protein [Mycena pura]